MRLLSWNVNSLRVRLAQTLRYVDETSPDVVCLQETRVSDGAFPRTAFEERGFSVVAHGSGGRNGVALLSRSGFGNVVRGLPSSANAEEG
ncbi:MAG TPA: endonuclease/exonuclease/phosphatase family protein, partial [Polyangiaceae bacterium]|nr:endonuclease/exonuclease/phosphatase family protein [Polyangiaceae bacterium]